MKNTIIILSIALLALSGCNKTPEVEIPITEISDISLTWKGIQQVVYTPSNCQLSYNDQKHEYRVYDDKLANWFCVRCSEKPSSEGQQLYADVSWTGKSSTKTFNALQFTVQKTQDDGLVWLWNASGKIGIVIKNI